MRNAPRGPVARLALWMLWLAVVLTAVGALLVFVYAHFVFVSIPNAEVQWTPVFSPILVAAVSLLGSIWALRSGHLLLTTGLTLVSAGLAAIMAFVVAFVVGWNNTESATTVSPTWVNIISAVAAACFVLCVLTVIACVVALARERLRPTP